MPGIECKHWYSVGFSPLTALIIALLMIFISLSKAETQLKEEVIEIVNGSSCWKLS